MLFKRSGLTGENLTGRLWYRYLIVFLTVVVLVATNHFVIKQSLRLVEDDKELISISERQRTLSQKAVLSAARFLYTGSPFHAAQLESAIFQFEIDHEQLVNSIGDDVRLFRIYRVGDVSGLDYKVHLFVSHAWAVFAPSGDGLDAQVRFNTLEEVASNALMADLDRAVSGFEARAATRREMLWRIQQFVHLSSLLILAAGVLFGFGPLHRKITHAFERLSEEANYDALTGLLNRRRFGDLLQETACNQQSQTSLAVIAMDLDGFKAVNDALGHPAGDKLLRQIAEAIKEQTIHLKSTVAPLLARVGGDEFMLACVLPTNCALERIGDFGEQMLSKLQQPIELKVGESSVTCLVGMSIGYCLDNGNHFSVERLQSNADIALYTSKKTGKGRLTRFRDELRVNAEKRLRLETDIRRGLLSGEFRPYFQPQIDLRTGSLIGFELLARWEHSEMGLLTPDYFLSDAEQMGLLDMIEASLILNALESIKSLYDEGYDVPRLSLNISSQTLRDRDFVTNFLSTMNMFELPVSAVGLEIKETVLIENEEDPAIRSIKQLSAAGFVTLVDDFGTGYASLGAVSGLELHGIKIDGSLVARANCASGIRVLRASVAMGKSMGLLVCAEGAETQKDFDVLRAIGCDIAQGHFVGAPTDILGARTIIERNIGSVQPQRPGYQAGN